MLVFPVSGLIHTAEASFTNTAQNIVSVINTGAGGKHERTSLSVGVVESAIQLSKYLHKLIVLESEIILEIYIL